MNAPYGYSYSESGWLYFADTAGPIWFYNFGTAQWSDIGPSGWSWFQYPYTYSLDLSTWVYVQAPAGGIYVYHFNSQVWTLLN